MEELNAERRAKAASESFSPSDAAADVAAKMACDVLDKAHTALRAALAVMTEAGCSKCRNWRIYEHHKHNDNCKWMTAINLVKAALGEKV